MAEGERGVTETTGGESEISAELGLLLLLFPTLAIVQLQSFDARHSFASQLIIFSSQLALRLAVTQRLRGKL